MGMVGWALIWAVGWVEGSELGAGFVGWAVSGIHGWFGGADLGFGVRR